MNRHRNLILPTAALAAAIAITACTPSASTAPQATSSAPSAAPASGQASPPLGGAGAPGGAGVDFAKVQQCLQAAGLTLPTGSFALPSGSFALPSGGLPSGFVPGGSFAPPAGAGALNDPKVQAALKACGISLPGGAPAPSN